MYCYVVKWPVFRLQRGSAKSPLAPSVLDLYGLAYSNQRYLEGEGVASIPAKIWGMYICTPEPQVPTVLLLGIFLVWFEKDLKVKFNQICIKRKGNISLIGTKNASWNERITVISVTYEVIFSTDQNCFHNLNQILEKSCIHLLFWSMTPEFSNNFSRIIVKRTTIGLRLYLRNEFLILSIKIVIL